MDQPVGLGVSLKETSVCVMMRPARGSGKACAAHRRRLWRRLPEHQAQLQLRPIQPLRTGLGSHAGCRTRRSR